MVAIKAWAATILVSQNIFGMTTVSEQLQAIAGKRVNDSGEIIIDDSVVATVSQGELRKVAGKKVDSEGKIFNKKGKHIGTVELVAEDGDEDHDESSNESQMGSSDNDDGENEVGQEEEEDDDDESESHDQHENGKEDHEDNGEGDGEQSEQSDNDNEDPEGLQKLNGLKVNEEGNVVDEENNILAKVSEGNVEDLVGKSVGSRGEVLGGKGDIIGHTSLVQGNEDFEQERLEAKKNGSVDGENQEQEEDSSDNDSHEPIEAIEAMEVNDDGNVVDENGKILAKVTEGKLKKLAGRKVSGGGEILNSKGKKIGQVELIDQDEGNEEREEEQQQEDEPKTENGMEDDGPPEDEDEGSQEAIAEKSPFNFEFDGDSVVDSKGRTVGRIVEGDSQSLQSVHDVDTSGILYDSNGTSLGKVRLNSGRLSEDGVKSTGTLASIINNAMSKIEPLSDSIENDEVKDLGASAKKGQNLLSEVKGGITSLDPDGKLTATAKELVPKGDAVSEQYDLVDACEKLDKATVVIDDATERAENPPEEEPSEEEKKKQAEEQELRDKANQMGQIIDASLGKMIPICDMMNDALQKAERDQRDKKLDEKKLVETLRPLIEKGGNLLQETYGALRALDPDSKIAETAKARANSHDGTSEEYYLASKLSKLTDKVQTTIDNAKKKIENMPQAKKDLGPLLSLMQEPLFQIISAVGLLLSGVVGLLRNLLGGLGLGGILDKVLGSIGLDKILEGLGIPLKQ